MVIFRRASFRPRLQALSDGVQSRSGWEKPLLNSSIIDPNGLREKML